MPKYILPPKEPVKAIKISEEEYRKQMAIREFELNVESKTIAYFMDKLDRCEYQPALIDVKQFYLTKAIENLERIEDPVNEELLANLIESSSNEVH